MEKALNSNTHWWPTRAQWEEAEQKIATRKFGFFDGGCFILAVALTKVISGSTIATMLLDGEVDHYLIKLPLLITAQTGLIYADAGGCYRSSEAAAKSYAKRIGEVYKNLNISVIDRLVSCPAVPRSAKLSKELAQILQNK